MVSRASNAPASSTQRVRDTKRVFACRALKAETKLDEQRHMFLVRNSGRHLAARAQVCSGVGAHRHSLAMGKLPKDADFGEALFHVCATTRWATARARFELHAQELFFPLQVRKGGSGGVRQWLSQVPTRMPRDEWTQWLDALDTLNHQWIKTIDASQVLIVPRSDQTEPHAFYPLFNRLNRTDVKRSAFTLRPAPFWPRHLPLYALGDKVLADSARLEAVAVDPSHSRQSLPCASRTSPSCPRSEVLHLAAADITVWWDTVVPGLAPEREILRDDGRVMLPTWLLYPTMLPPRAAVLGRAGRRKTTLEANETEAA